jgi:hypothetical protein
MNAVSKNLLPFLKKSVEMLNNAEDIANEFKVSETGKTMHDANQYFRFSVPQGMQELNLDNYKETKRMRALTYEYLRKVGNGRIVERHAQSLHQPDENSMETLVS